MVFLKNKEGIKIIEDNKPKIYGKKRTRLRIRYNKKTIFEVMEIRNKRTYYLIENRISNLKIFIRDDEKKLDKLTRDIINDLEDALSKKFDRVIVFTGIRDGDLYFEDDGEFFIEVDDEEFDEERDTFRFKKYKIPMKVYVGDNSGKIIIHISALYLINEFINRIEKRYKIKEKVFSSPL